MIWKREDLGSRYGEILAAGLSPSQKEYFERRGEFSPDVVVQTSGGSSGRGVLRIPRSRADIFSLYEVVLSAYSSVYSEPAERVALLGGVSHSQAALKFTAGRTRFESFSLDQIGALKAFRPDFVSCYPSIARELAAEASLDLPELRAIKLGGEPVFRSDVRRLMARFPGVCVIEQLGSTEMPGMAIGVYRTPSDLRSLELQTQRFEFSLKPHSDWQPLVVRDKFPDLLFPIPGRFDTGDEVKVENGAIAAVRRRNDPVNPFLPWLDEWLGRGCVNLQIDRASSLLTYSGGAALPERICLGGLVLRTKRGALRRLPESNKLPLFVA